MKTSIKILIGITITIVVILLVGLWIMRRDLSQFLQRSEMEKYKTFEIDTFRHLHISAPWNVHIRQGKEFKIQIAVADTIFNPAFEQIDGTLYLKVHPLDTIKPHEVFIKVMAPSIQSIYAKNGVKLNMQGVTSDSLSVTLEDGCIFKGKENEFKNISFKSSGDAYIELTNPPVF